ncbi:hypothetical protein [Anoxynatronum buryatiense]|uniref:hypothetical protein n=1 Tax=Anoxynatronum buryatiense TaxID=489973 RepID=UPI0024B6A523|nr:hypothetical protein [Anoxynatronum buryatiense]
MTMKEPWKMRSDDTFGLLVCGNLFQDQRDFRKEKVDHFLADELTFSQQPLERNEE